MPGREEKPVAGSRRGQQELHLACFPHDAALCPVLTQLHDPGWHLGLQALAFPERNVY